jgi:hypothetical protein
MSSTNSPVENNKEHSNEDSVDETKDIESIQNNQVRDRVKEKEEESESSSTVPAEE